MDRNRDHRLDREHHKKDRRSERDLERDRSRRGSRERDNKGYRDRRREKDLEQDKKRRRERDTRDDKSSSRRKKTKEDDIIQVLTNNYFKILKEYKVKRICNCMNRRLNSKLLVVRWLIIGRGCRNCVR